MAHSRSVNKQELVPSSSQPADPEASDSDDADDQPRTHLEKEQRKAERAAKRARKEERKRKRESKRMSLDPSMKKQKRASGVGEADMAKTSSQVTGAGSQPSPVEGTQSTRTALPPTPDTSSSSPSPAKQSAAQLPVRDSELDTPSTPVAPTSSTNVVTEVSATPVSSKRPVKVYGSNRRTAPSSARKMVTTHRDTSPSSISSDASDMEDERTGLSERPNHTQKGRKASGGAARKWPDSDADVEVDDDQAAASGSKKSADQRVKEKGDEGIRKTKSSAKPPASARQFEDHLTNVYAGMSTSNNGESSRPVIQPKKRSRHVEKESDASLRARLASKVAMNEFLASQFRPVEELQRLEREGILTYKRGMLTEQEKRAIRSHLDAFSVANRMDEEELLQVIMSKGRERQRAPYPKFWPEVAAVVPGRPVKYVRVHVQRMYDPRGRKGAWKKEEDDELLRAYEVHPDQWTKIAAIVDRTEADCRDRWKNELQHRDVRRVGAWTPFEEQDLIRAVKEANEQAGNDPLSYEAPWDVVVHNMGYLRSRTQCRQKWHKHLHARAGDSVRSSQSSSRGTPLYLVPKVEPRARAKGKGKATAKAEEDLSQEGEEVKPASSGTGKKGKGQAGPGPSKGKPNANGKSTKGKGKASAEVIENSESGEEDEGEPAVGEPSPSEGTDDAVESQIRTQTQTQAVSTKDDIADDSDSEALADEVDAVAAASASESSKRGSRSHASEGEDEIASD